MWRVVDNLDDDEEYRRYINHVSTVKGCGISDPKRDNNFSRRKLNRFQEDLSEYENCVLIGLKRKLVPFALKIDYEDNCSAIVKVYGAMRIETNGRSTKNWYLLYKKNGDVSNNSELTLVNSDMNCTKMIHALRIHYNYRKIKETALNVFVTCFELNPVQLKIKMLNDKILTTKSGNEEKFDYFSILPNEIIAKIFEYFDLKTLARTAQVCSRFNDIVTKTDQFYYNLDFQPYWNVMSADVFDRFMDKTKNLKKLRLFNWHHEYPNDSKLERFLDGAKNTLTYLYINSGRWIYKKPLIKAIFACKELSELHLIWTVLWPARIAAWFNADIIQCKNLQKLEISHSTIAHPQLIEIISKTRKLKHLILDYITLGPLDNILEKLVEFEINLETWSSRYSRFADLNKLSLCQFHTNLEELDLSGCYFTESQPPTFTLNFLAKCPRLKRLGLARWWFNGIKDIHLTHVIKNCKKLEQLDISHLRFITANGIKGLLKSESLEFLNISYCSHETISLSQIKEWHKEYPQMQISSNLFSYFHNDKYGKLWRRDTFHTS